MKLKNKKIYNIVRKLYYKYPSMRKFIFGLDKKFLFKPAEFKITCNPLIFPAKINDNIPNTKNIFWVV